jgi:hypothetical protein
VIGTPFQQPHWLLQLDDMRRTLIRGLNFIVTGTDPIGQRLKSTSPIFDPELRKDAEFYIPLSARFINSSAKMIGDVDSSLCPIGSAPVGRKSSPRISVCCISPSWKREPGIQALQPQIISSLWAIISLVATFQQSLSRLLELWSRGRGLEG